MSSLLFEEEWMDEEKVAVMKPISFLEILPNRVSIP